MKGLATVTALIFTIVNGKFAHAPPNPMFVLSKGSEHDFKLKAYTWNSVQTGTKQAASSTLSLNGDVGIRWDLPL